MRSDIVPAIICGVVLVFWAVVMKFADPAYRPPRNPFKDKHNERGH